MKPFAVILFMLFCCCYTLQAQIIRPFTLRYSNPSVRGNIVYVANNIITTASTTTTEAPPGGTAVNSGTGVNVDIDGSSFINYITTGSIWKYLDNDTRPAGWETSGFNDAAWASGPSQLGFGDGDEATTTNGGPGGNRYVTTYFRKTVTLPAPSTYNYYAMNVTYDDGFVVYVNGVEVNRTGMAAGAVTHSTLANVTSENSTVTVNIPTSAFTTGTNVIAVEVHQVNITSSDISFDMTLNGMLDPTFNSSSADLNLSSCTQVMWAGLYWGAGQGANGGDISWITGENTVKLKVPGAGSYVNVTSTQTDYHNNTLIPGYAHSGFKCYADITSLVNTLNANGTYTIGNVASPAGYTDAYGGWTIVIAYTNATLPIRNLSVYDGNAAVKSGSGNVDVGISGFLTPPSGPVSCELGAVAYDGDRGSLDAFYFKAASASTFYNLTPNSTSNADDMWNSTISYKGSVITTRNPAHQNTLGYDADIIDLPNTSNAQLGNNETGATVRFSSPSENYIVQVLSTSITQFNPSVKFVKTAVDLNGGSLVGGDVLRYRLDFKNVGVDAGTNTIITDNIPAGSSYKPGTLKINGVAKTDAAADDEADYSVGNNNLKFRIGTGANSTSGGTVTATNSVTDSGYIEFDVYVTSSCVITGCTNTLSNSARVDYKGFTSLANLYDSSGIISGGCFTLGPLTNAISGSCFIPRDTIMLNSCPATNVSLPVSLYAGYQFYSAMPFSSANKYDPLTPVTSTRVIWAFGSNGACTDTVKIRLNISSCPDIDKDKDGLPDYVESNIAGALLDADGDGTPNYRDTDYPSFADYNGDGINDNFDPGADANNNGIPNFLDPSFAGYIDSNGDGVNDKMDSDKDGVPDFLDIDSDNDGIPDNIEAQTTNSFKFPTGVDTDNDGLDNAYDTFSGVGGNGLTPLDSDADTKPDYLDTDSDADGRLDIYEGNDFNHNGYADDGVALTGLDSDGDGLDNFFDLDNSSIKGTSAYMGTNGSVTGDPLPGSKTTVQRTTSSSCATERDWRCTAFVLDCKDIQLKGTLRNKMANIDWINICLKNINYYKLERSIDGQVFQGVAQITSHPANSNPDKYSYSDNVEAINASVIYYRVLIMANSGAVQNSAVIALKDNKSSVTEIHVMPNPVRNDYNLSVQSEKSGTMEVQLFDQTGNRLTFLNQKMIKGNNNFNYLFPPNMQSGLYYLQVRVNSTIKVIKLNHLNNQ